MLLWCLLPPGAESKAVQVWLRRERGGREGRGREEVEKGGRGAGRWVRGGATRRSPEAPFAG